MEEGAEGNEKGLSPAARRHLELLIGLWDLVLKDPETTDEEDRADEIRDQLDGTWEELCRDERRFVERMAEALGKANIAGLKRGRKEAEQGPPDPGQDPEYQKFVEEQAKHCSCRPAWARPCDGVLAGGMCEEMDWEGDGEEEIGDDD